MNILLRTFAAVASITAGVLHWDIWAHHGYRSTPIREMFIASAAVGVVVGLIAFLPSRGSAILAGLANAVFLGAFALSRVSKVPTFHGSFSETGLAPKDAMLLGASTTLLLLVAEGVAAAFGLGSILFGRPRRSRPLPAEVSRA